MATATAPEKVILFLGIMYHDENLRDRALERFTETFGAIATHTEGLDFSDFSSYYDKEMGGQVFKQYLLFETLVDRETLAQIKTFTNELELEFAQGDLRPINLDPGYLAKDKFVLASAKDFAHRIYIGEGIYAEVTLHFHHGKVRFFSWSYRDYLQEPVEKFLLEGRERLLKG